MLKTQGVCFLSVLFCRKKTVPVAYPSTSPNRMDATSQAHLGAERQLEGARLHGVGGLALESSDTVFSCEA